MTDQADMEARAGAILSEAHRTTSQAEYNSSGTVTFAAARRAMLAYGAERETAAYARAAEVARGCILIDSGFGNRREGMQSAREQISDAIEALGEATP